MRMIFDNDDCDESTGTGSEAEAAVLDDADVAASTVSGSSSNVARKKRKMVAAAAKRCDKVLIEIKSVRHTLLLVLETIVS